MFTKILGQSLEKPLNSKIKSVMKGHRTIFLNLKKNSYDTYGYWNKCDTIRLHESMMFLYCF